MDNGEGERFVNGNGVEDDLVELTENHDRTHDHHNHDHKASNGSSSPTNSIVEGHGPIPRMFICSTLTGTTCLLNLKCISSSLAFLPILPHHFPTNWFVE